MGVRVEFEELVAAVDSDGIRRLADDARADLEAGEEQAARQFMRERKLCDVVSGWARSGASRVWIRSVPKRSCGRICHTSQIAVR